MHLRLVYTTHFTGWLFGLHAWKKKSTQGIATSKGDTDLINARLRTAEEKHKELLAARRQVLPADQKRQ
jgi:phage-related protein